MLQLLIENSFQILSVLKVPQRHLGRQLKAVSGIALHQSFSHSLLPVVAVVGVGGVKIGEPLCQERVKQPFDLLEIEGIRLVRLEHRQSHTSKSKVCISFLCHKSFLLFVLILIINYNFFPDSFNRSFFSAA